MKKMTKLLLILILSNSTLYLQAQDLPLMTPNNVQEVADLIYERFNGQIDEDYNNVYSFLSSLLPSSDTSPNYDENCTPPPSPLISEVTNVKIAFDWEDSAIPDLLDYKVSYIKLNNLPPNGTSDTGNEFTPFSFVDFNVTDGLMIVAFQSRCQASDIITTGRINVIIVDKPVFVQDVIAGCSCKKDKITITKDFSGAPEGAYDSVNIPYSHPGNIGSYVGRIDYDNGDVAKFVTEIKFLNSGNTIEVGLHNDCMLNLFKQGGGSYLNSNVSNGEGNTLLQMGVLTFSNGFTFNAAEGISGSIKVTLCSRFGTTDKGPQRNDHAGNNEQFDLSDDKFNQILSYPNPAKDNITFSIPESLVKSSYEYSVLDIFGKPINEQTMSSNSTDEKVDLNISKLPAGSYIFLVKGTDEIMKNRFVKIN